MFITNKLFIISKYWNNNHVNQKHINIWKFYKYWKLLLIKFYYLYNKIIKYYILYIIKI